MGKKKEFVEPELKSEIDILVANLSKRIKDLKLKLNTSVYGLANMTSIDHNTIGRWDRGEVVPLLDTLAQFTKDINFHFIKEKINEQISVAWLLSSDTELTGQTIRVTRFTKETEYQAVRNRLLESTVKTLDMQFRIGSDLHAFSSVLKNLLQKESVETIRLLLPATDADTIMEILAQSRNEKEDRTSGATKFDIETTRSKMERMAENPEIRHKINIKYFKNLPSSIMYLSDAEMDSGIIFTVLSSYQQKYHKAPVTIIPKQASPPVFAFYVQEFNNMWEAGDIVFPPDKDELANQI